MSADKNQPGGEIVLYQTEDGETRIECRFENENVWMTQALMAELFHTTPQNITLHLRAIYEEGELSETAACKDYLQVRHGQHPETAGKDRQLTGDSFYCLMNLP
jgi:hypothetical protein